jgi:hypothetical protein
VSVLSREVDVREEDREDPDVFLMGKTEKDFYYSRYYSILFITLSLYIMCVYMYIYVCICVCIHTYVCVYVNVYVCVHVRLSERG